jgi:hypothetical protein
MARRKRTEFQKACVASVITTLPRSPDFDDLMPDGWVRLKWVGTEMDNLNLMLGPTFIEDTGVEIGYSASVTGFGGRTLLIPPEKGITRKRRIKTRRQKDVVKVIRGFVTGIGKERLPELFLIPRDRREVTLMLGAFDQEGNYVVKLEWWTSKGEEARKECVHLGALLDWLEEHEIPYAWEGEYTGKKIKGRLAITISRE